MKFEKNYLSLPGHFYARVDPTPVREPVLLAWNSRLGDEFGWGEEPVPDAAQIFGGNRVPEGAEPVALAYAGHQFGHFVPQLGDGRAVLLGEVRDAAGALREIQLKGGGRTPFSRRGDGRSALGPALREFLVSEAMAALGVPTTRSLAVVGTGERVIREEILPGGVVTRVASSHVRVGTFQYFAARGDYAAVEVLAQLVLRRNYPHLEGVSHPYLQLLEAVAARQAALIARWMGVGFIHGVMNTDNMAVSGETIDYGPCAFLDVYSPEQVYSAIDRGGRYAFCNQPAVAQWNLARFAETLLPLIDADSRKAIELAGGVVAEFLPQFEKHWLEVFSAKIGIASAREGDRSLVEALLEAMAAGRADFTLTFRHLCAAAQDPAADARVRDLFSEPGLYDAWALRWRERLRGETRSTSERFRDMCAVNPALIPRNHRVEQVLEAAVRVGDLEPFKKLFHALSHPYSGEGEHTRDALPPGPGEEITNTFCGT